MQKQTPEQIIGHTHLLIQASDIGDTNQVNHLIADLGSDTESKSLALRVAVEQGCINIVRLLIPLSDPKENNSVALSLAAIWGHTEIVQMLIPVTDPKANDSYAVRWAASKGHLDIIKLLIPVSNPKSDDSQALRRAVGRGKIECIKLLIPVSDYNLALHMMQNHHNCNVLKQCVDEYESLLQKERLTQALSCNEHHKTTLKRRI